MRNIIYVGTKENANKIQIEIQFKFQLIMILLQTFLRSRERLFLSVFQNITTEQLSSIMWIISYCNLIIF